MSFWWPRTASGGATSRRQSFSPISSSSKPPSKLKAVLQLRDVPLSSKNIFWHPAQATYPPENFTPGNNFRAVQRSSVLSTSLLRIDSFIKEGAHHESFARQHPESMALCWCCHAHSSRILGSGLGLWVGELWHMIIHSDYPDVDTGTF